MDTLNELLEQLNSLDLTYEELGSVNGWQSATEIKNQLTEFLGSACALSNEFSENISDEFKKQEDSKLKRACEYIKHQFDSIDPLVKKGTNVEHYPSQRDAITKRLEDGYRKLQLSFHDLQAALKIEKIEENLQRGQVIEELESSALASSESIKKLESDAETLLDQLRNELSDYSSRKAASEFSGLSTAHNTQANIWLFIFVISSVSTGVVVFWALGDNMQPSVDLTYALAEIIRRLAVVSISATFMKISLNKYNVERNLKILYEHRNTVLNQYTLFESAIRDDDLDAKNEFRLEIARVIFNDPRTGYIDSSGSGEININPVISAAERAVSNKA